jgi:hypothetical protein
VTDPEKDVLTTLLARAIEAHDYGDDDEVSDALATIASTFELELPRRKDDEETDPG